MAKVDAKELFEKFLQNPAGAVDVVKEDTRDVKQIVGVPLGGIGTGKIELTPDGAFRHFTINNNYVFPIDGMEGTFLALAVGGDRGYDVRVLSSRPQLELKDGDLLLKPEEISYKGLWPQCIVGYSPAGLPVRVTLTAFSPVIPRRLDTSCLPIAYFVFDVENVSGGAVDVSLNFSWEDVNGCWGAKVSWDDFVPSTEPHFSDDRGIVRVHSLSGNVKAASFHHRERHPEVADFAWGDYTLAVGGDGIEAYVHQYAPKEAEAVLGELKERGRLPDKVTNLKGEYAAIVGSALSLRPGEKKRIVYVLSWYTPEWWGFGDGSIAARVATPEDFAGRKIGHWYANLYASSLEIVNSHFDKAEEYLREVESWQDFILSSSLPVWLKEMLINNNYILSATQYWAKDGRYSILESPNCPCVGTLDQRFYGSPSTMLFVPPLEHRELMLYAEKSDKMYELTGKNRGQIYHDFGNNRLDAMNDYGHNWIDLNPKFVLLCWRNYLYSGNLDNLREIYYKMKEAMERENELDKDGDGLPEGYGNCNTYEGRFFGANSYDGGLWLAALKVFPEVARLMGESEEAGKYEKLFEKAKASFERKLWNAEKGHFIKCTEKRSPDPNTQCRDDQLVGQWYAHFLEKGYILDERKVRKALSSMVDILKLEIPDTDGAFIIRNEEYHNEAPTSGNWPGYSVAHFGAEAIYEGMVDVGLGSAEGIWELLYKRYRMAWDQPLGLNIKGRPRGDRYMNSGSIWYLLWALEGFWVKVREGIMKISPNIPDGWKEDFRAPIVTSSFWGRMSWRETENSGGFSASLELVLDADFTLNRLILKGCDGRSPKEFKVEGADCPIRVWTAGFNEVVFEFEGGLDLLRGEVLKVDYEL